MKLTPAQAKLLIRVQISATGRYAVQAGQKASAAVLLREGVVVDDTQPGDFCKFIKLAGGK